MRPYRRTVWGDLQTAQVEAAIHVDDLAGGVIEQSIGDGAHGFGDIRAFAHTTLRDQAAGDALFIRFLGRGDHVRPDDARPDFENLNPAGRQALGVQRYRHAERRFGDAVFSPV